MPRFWAAVRWRQTGGPPKRAACRLIGRVCGIPPCFAPDNYRVPIEILPGGMCWCKWARSKLRQVRSPCPLSLFLLPRNSSTSFLVFGLEIKGIRGKKISPVRLNIFIKTRKRGSDLFISTALKDLPRERRTRGDSGQQNSSLSTVGRPTLAFRSANKDVAILQSSARHHNCHPLCLEVA